MYDGQLKTVSFLPSGNMVYPQMPYTQITKEEYDSYVKTLKKINWGKKDTHEMSDIMCDGEACAIL